VSRRLRAALCGAVLSVGCHTTVVRSGLPAGRAPAGYESHWHHGFLIGALDASGSYPLYALCPEGWSEIRTERDFVTGLLTALTVWVYTPQRVTILCAAPRAGSSGATPIPHPPAEGPLPPPAEEPSLREEHRIERARGR
jgi:hypothetical protein